MKKHVSKTVTALTLTLLIGSLFNIPGSVKNILEPEPICSPQNDLPDAKDEDH